MNKLTHEEAYAELAAVALDAAPADFSAAVREHAGVCPECGPELAALEETVAQLAASLPSRAINAGRSAGIRSRLVMRARGEREAHAAIVPGGPPDLARGVASLKGLGHKLTPGSQRAVDEEVRRTIPQKQKASTWNAGYLLAAAAAIAFIASALQLKRVTSERDNLRAQLAQQTGSAVPDTIARPTSAADSMVSALAGREVKIMPLSDNSSAPMGRMFWNRESNEWTLVVYTMKKPKPGMTYQVWLVTDSAKISAGTFQPDPQGHAMVQAKYPLDRNALRAIAVTEEPMGGMPSPTGPIVVSGSASP